LPASTRHEDPPTLPIALQIHFHLSTFFSHPSTICQSYGAGRPTRTLTDFCPVDLTGPKLASRFAGQKLLLRFLLVYLKGRLVQKYSPPARCTRSRHREHREIHLPDREMPIDQILPLACRRIKVLCIRFGDNRSTRTRFNPEADFCFAASPPRKSGRSYRGPGKQKKQTPSVFSVSPW